MRICVLQPDYSTTGVDYKNYDPPRNLSSLLPEDTVDHVFLNKLTTYKQLLALSKQQYDCFVNLCEGYLEWEVPSIDVIHSLDLLNLPYTGPNVHTYDPTKELMKYVSYTEEVKTPAYVLIDTNSDILQETAYLNFPLFVKPAKAGDSLGIDESSMVQNQTELIEKCHSLLEEYPELLIENYIAGREFTVLLAADAERPKQPIIYPPVEYIFPQGKHFKTYSLKTSELHPASNVIVTDSEIIEKLSDAARKIFNSFGGIGYARLDFRMNNEGVIYFLEINFTCSVFYSDGYEGSADYILKADKEGPSGFLKQIIKEGIARHKSKQKKYRMKGNSISGYGIYATQPMERGEFIFRGEEKPHQLITLKWMEQHWNERDKRLFSQYALPVSSEIYIIWDEDPSLWAPQNHSCRPNTIYDGLNVIALRNIEAGEELTLDYSHLLDEHAEPFDCNCGAPQCKKKIRGDKENSFTYKEIQRRRLSH
ncbi:MAG: SET domain-containing protein-lysine N-methyltransferase [Bacteroidota bacterium]